jgi:hypothetical protein
MLPLNDVFDEEVLAKDIGENSEIGFARSSRYWSR